MKKKKNNHHPRHCVLEGVWRWLKRCNSFVSDSCFGKECLTDEEIHEITNLIHHDNPSKYEIKHNQSIDE